MFNEILYLFRDLDTGKKFYVEESYVTEELMETYELIKLILI